MKIAVLLNPSAGQDREELKELFARQGMMAAITVAKPDTLTEQARAIAKGCDVLVAGGGDGTVSAVAAGLVGSKTALGVLPLGTLNHFAKDLGIPLDVNQAIKRIGEGKVERVDVGEVNGWTFINNSSVGLYPTIVRMREQREQHIGKWPAFIASVWGALAHYHPIKLCYRIDGRDVSARVIMAFIGNNDYGLEEPGVSNRQRLDEGKLSLYIVTARGRLRLIWAAVAGLWKPTPQHIERYYPTEVSIDFKAPTVSLAMDGEVMTMTTPLEYTIRPKALRVVV